MNADDLFVQLTAEHDKIVAEANRYLNGMVDKYKHDLGVMVDQHNRYLERQMSLMVRSPKRKAKPLTDQ